MRASLVQREPERLARWEESDLYGRIRRARRGRTRFVLHDGPPFANGDVHVGTALNKILKDIVIRYRTLIGEDAPYVPGWDCHGLPIEFKVTQELRRQDREELEPARIRRACQEYAQRYIGIQRDQFRRLGVLGDWKDPYLTMDRSYEAEELRQFADLVEAGYVYRGKKPVYWSIPCRTALAEAEVEYRDHVCQSIYVKLPVVDAPGTFLLIWTTTPWTLPANLAVAYHPRLDYAQVRAGSETYLVCVSLLDGLAEKLGWEDFEILRTLEGSQLDQIVYRHPFCRRTGRLHEAGFVEDSVGTGFVHIAPGHGLEDYLLGREKGLPIYSPVDDQGRLAPTGDLPTEEQFGEPLAGASVLERGGSSEASRSVVDVLEAGGHLLHAEEYRHSYPHCWRSKTPVVFRAMDQWFFRLEHRDFRSRALEEIGRVRWIPGWGRNRIEGAVRTRPDWCISRQRTWGVPIPAFHGPGGEPILDPGVIRRTADLVEKHGSSVWFETGDQDLWKQVRPPDWQGPEAARKSMDTLDVWIDSGSSSRAVIARDGRIRGREGEPREAFQAHLYLEGSDQHRGWFQSSLLLSLAGNGAAPFESVLTHGFMVDEDREKISKSGQKRKPQTSASYVEEYGADILRLWVASQDFRNDIVVSSERIRKVGEAYRGIRNALRYQLSNLYDFDPGRDLVPQEDLERIDRWILWRTGAVAAEAMEAYGRYEFHAVYQKLSQFATVELSSIYHDAVKDRLYTLAAGHPRRRSTQTALWQMVRCLGQLLSPVLVFTADEAWEHVPGSRESSSIHETEYQPLSLELSPAERGEWELLFPLRDRVLRELESSRKAGRIGKALEAVVAVRTRSAEEMALESWGEDLRELLNVSHLQLVSPEERGEVLVDGRPLELSREVAVQPARDLGRVKCGRCWRWVPEVASSGGHDGLCGRCRDAVGSA